MQITLGMKGQVGKGYFIH